MAPIGIFRLLYVFPPFKIFRCSHLQAFLGTFFLVQTKKILPPISLNHFWHQYDFSPEHCRIFSWKLKRNSQKLKGKNQNSRKKLNIWEDLSSPTLSQVVLKKSLEYLNVEGAQTQYKRLALEKDGLTHHQPSNVLKTFHLQMKWWIFIFYYRHCWKRWSSNLSRLPNLE